MRRVVVCGAGFGGIAAAVGLRQAFPPAELEVVLIDRRRDFVMGLRKTWAALRIADLEDGRRELDRIAGVSVLHSEIVAIDPRAHTVDLGDRSIDADALVLALGAEHAVDAVPGAAEFAVDVWDRDRAADARQHLQGLTGGRLVIGILGLPYTCPPAPFELALLCRDRLGPSVDVSVFSPAPLALPVVGAAESAKLERLLAGRDIVFLPGRVAAGVSAGATRFADGSELAHDVLLGVPVHRCPPLLIAAGLAEAGGWVGVDARTLETSCDGVYAIGDCTVIKLANGLALPKAGVFAQAQGEVVAARIGARFGRRTSEATFTGHGFCYIETGRGEAARVEGHFLADPVNVGISEPSAAGLAEKHEFERSRLAAWFGA